MFLIIADTQPVTAYAISQLATQTHLCGQDDVCSVSTIAQLRERLQSLKAEASQVVVVVDYTLLNCSEDELILLHQRFSKVRFVLFSDQLSKDFLRRMLFCDEAFSVVFKDESVDEIHACISEAGRGRQYVSVQARAIVETSDGQAIERSPLTTTEREILRLMAKGKSSKEIAAERYLSTYTVMTHRKNIFRKLAVNNAQEAIRYALRAGIVDPLEYYI